MGVGYTTIMYDKESLLEGIEEIGACQYDGIEIGLGTVHTIGQRNIQDRLAAYDLDLYCVMGEWLESDEAADRVAEGASTAAALDAPFLGILPPHRSTVDDAALESWLEHVCEAASDAGITPVLHHHGGTHVEQLDEIRTWLDRAPDNLGLLWDTAHHYPYGEHYPAGDVTDGIDRFADNIEYVHLKDVAPSSNFEEHCAALSRGEFKLDTIFHYYNAFSDLGNGVIDFSGVRDALDESGYDGPITIEIEKQTKATLVHAKKNLDFWTNL